MDSTAFLLMKRNDADDHLETNAAGISLQQAYHAQMGKKAFFWEIHTE